MHIRRFFVRDFLINIFEKEEPVVTQVMCRKSCDWIFLMKAWVTPMKLN